VPTDRWHSCGRVSWALCELLDTAGPLRCALDLSVLWSWLSTLSSIVCLLGYICEWDEPDTFNLLEWLGV
jgi:hypothetical protein